MSSKAIGLPLFCVPPLVLCPGVYCCGAGSHPFQRPATEVAMRTCMSTIDPRVDCAALITARADRRVVDYAETRFLGDLGYRIMMV